MGKSVSSSKGRIDLGLPLYSFSEELINSITHALGVGFAVFAFVFLILKFWGSAGSIAAVSVYCLSLLVLYSGSALYHGVRALKIKSCLRKLDHCSIFLLIAGTYTPLCTIYVGGVGSKVILSLVWLFAIIGVIINIIDVNKFSTLSLFCYILMGWSVIFIAKQTLASLSSFQTFWLVAGGVFYTVGAALYVLGKKVKYMHCVWHFFVLAGSVCHFMILV